MLDFFCGLCYNEDVIKIQKRKEIIFMKQTVKILSLFLVAILMLSLTACGKKELSGSYEIAEPDNSLYLVGTYSTDSALLGVTYVFTPTEVTVSMLGGKMSEPRLYTIEEKDGEYTLIIDGDECELEVVDVNHIKLLGSLDLYAEEGSVKLDMNPVEFEFEGDEVTMTVASRWMAREVDSKTYKGTYEIEEDQITLDFEDRDARKWSDTFDFEEDEDCIVIDDVEYEK